MNYARHGVVGLEVGLAVLETTGIVVVREHVRILALLCETPSAH
jgi:hypothetical protein